MSRWDPLHCEEQWRNSVTISTNDTLEAHFSLSINMSQGNSCVWDAGEGSLHARDAGIAGLHACLMENCPIAFQGAYMGKEKYPTVVLEAVADHNL